jgi:protein involved in polysaccharide export with SLBB domain
MNLLKRFSFLAVLGLCAGCMRFDVLPRGAPNLTVPFSKPRAVDDQNLELIKSPTRIYRIGPKDVIRVDVRKDPTFSQQPYTVTAEGNIFLPNIGSVRIADLTTQEAEAKLNQVLAANDYIREPDAKVGVLEYQSKVVVGQVANPGPQVMKADMLTLQEAIFGAGLPTPDASLKRTHVITPDYTNPVVRQVNLNDIVYKGKMAENILLRPNDIVYVPSRYSTNLSSAIKELLLPFNDINDFRFRSNIANNYGGNSNGNSGKSSKFLF